MIKIDGIMPVFPSTDLDRTIRFYVDVLGFEEAWRWPSNEHQGGATHAAVRASDTQIMFALKPDGSTRSAAAYIFVENVDELYQSIAAVGGVPENQPAHNDYGMRDFNIADPDGNTLTFGAASGEPRDPD